MGNRSVVPLMRNLFERFKRYCREVRVNGVALASAVPEMYQAQVWDPLFGPNGQYETEVFRFK
jgi:hypothetical protein